MQGHSRKMAVGKSGSGSSPEPDPTGTLSSAFPASRTVRKIFLLLKAPSLWYFYYSSLKQTGIKIWGRNLDWRRNRKESEVVMKDSFGCKKVFHPGKEAMCPPLPGGPKANGWAFEGEDWSGSGLYIQSWLCHQLALE